MSPESFVYWLQGFAEISDEFSLDTRQWQIVKDHLNLVLNKETPDRNEIKQMLEIKQQPGSVFTMPQFNPSILSPNNSLTNITC